MQFISSLESKFRNVSLKDKQKRMVRVEKETKKLTRELQKDRALLERTESQIMSKLKQFLNCGDLPKAKMIAKQLAAYRNISDKNFARSIQIQIETQIRISNLKINQSHVNFLKAMNYAYGKGSIQDLKNQEAKYHSRQELQFNLEKCVNEGFDSMFEEFEDEIDNYNPQYIDKEVSSIIREAFDPAFRIRDYSLKKNDSIKKFFGNTRLNLKTFGDDIKCCSIFVPTLEISVDMLKRFIQNDKFIVKQLGIVDMSSVQVGIIIDKKFSAFKGTLSLIELNISFDDELFIHIDQVN